MPKNKQPAPNAAPRKPKPAAKSGAAGKTNKISGSLVKCEVKLEKGEWITPSSCQIFHIDADTKFPDICFEIKTDDPGPYQWSWEIKWSVLACPQKRDKKRFSPKTAKLFSEKGTLTSQSKQWQANLNDKIIGGDLTVKVKAGTTTFVRKTFIHGKEPGEQKINAELDAFPADFKKQAALAKKIFKQESKYLHFYSDERPLVSFDNGYGLGQATNPTPSFEQVWNWKKHVEYIVKTVITEKRKLARKYLANHGNFTEDDVDTETLVYYNGANFHYLVWDAVNKKWIENANVLCDHLQSNTGWDMTKEANKGKTLEQLRKNEGTKPSYTGRCYAEHIKSH